tara:strand:- start:7 stop:180 length:174 start_codon:yes stop_codon:yes gene_type:complete
MSIKSFHILFIIASFVLSMGVGYWGINEYPAIGILSFIGGILLVYYGIQVFKKFKTI